MPPDRQVLRHALDRPLREPLDVAEPPALGAGHVELEDVHQFVAQHVVVVPIGAGEGHQRAASRRLGDATDFLRQIPDDVVLLECGVVRVQHDRLLGECVPHRQRVPHVPALCHAGGIRHRQRLGRIVVDVEVLRVQRRPLEGLIIDLVLAEILGVGAPGSANHHHGGEPQQERNGHRSGSHGLRSEHHTILFLTPGITSPAGYNGFEGSK